MTLPLLIGLALGACTRAPDERPRAISDSAAAAIALDRPERPLVPLAGAFRLEKVSVERAGLDRAPSVPPVVVAPAEPSHELPVPEPGEPPAPKASASPRDERTLLPPIARGAPARVVGGRGGQVTLDVRVDENGDVSDALLAASDADSLAVDAAIEAALGMRYHPALLGGRPTAVWTRQVIDVKKSGERPRR
jgi:outer membrane biosynthesis protein TonB